MNKFIFINNYDNQLSRNHMFIFSPQENPYFDLLANLSIVICRTSVTTKLYNKSRSYGNNLFNNIYLITIGGWLHTFLPIVF